MYEQILVPLDGSPVDQAILKHIARLAPIHNSSVILLRVAHYHTRDGRVHETEEARAYLDKVERQLRELGLTVTSVIAPGEPADIILAEAESRGCDLIAMSTHGHKLLGDLFLGSVATEIRHRTSIPILLIRGGSTLS